MKLKTLGKALALSAGAFLVSAGIASAATVTNDLNLRSGPGTGYRVVDTMPAGAYVNVIGCSGSWCRVSWRGRVGYASASYLGGGRSYASAPVYVRPPPVVSFGFSTGPHWQNRPYGYRNDSWRGRHHGYRR